ncbi:MAG TPA: hypothetical protein PKN48_00285 [Bacteroidales bacterium]|mgnify:CR=1 FL=1|nr:hypothetical protein [Bacteroidales bacterium]
MIPVDRAPQGEQIRVDMSLAKDILCTNCKHTYFTVSRRYKFMSKLVSPNGKDLFIPVEVLLCNKCGTELDPEKAINILLATMPAPAEAIVPEDTEIDDLDIRSIAPDLTIDPKDAD